MSSIPRLAIASMLLGLTLPASLNAQDSDDLPVCVGADRVLRRAIDEKCPAGQTLYRLAQAGGSLEPAGDEQQTAQTQRPPAELLRRIEALTQRVAALEAAGAQTSRNNTGGGRTTGGGIARRVTAPFEVVDNAGRPIFRVLANPRSFALYMPSGEIVVTGSALSGGGFVKALAVDQGLQTVMGVNGGFAGFVAREKETARATLSIHDLGKASVEIANDDGKVVANLLHGASGGGQLLLGDPTGAAMVEAGTTVDGVGVVRAYPLGNPGVGLVGAPGTFIHGKR
jgi:hypothetical protein